MCAARPTVWLTVALAVVGGVMAVACGLNPRPEDPGISNDDGSSFGAPPAGGGFDDGRSTSNGGSPDPSGSPSPPVVEGPVVPANEMFDPERDGGMGVDPGARLDGGVPITDGGDGGEVPTGTLEDGA